MTPTAPNTFAAFVGIDWVAAQHDGGLQAAGAAKRAGCLDLHQGPLGFALRTYACRVLCPIHPLPVARYRDAFPPSQAKDDPSDAALQLALLRTPRAQLPPRTPPSPTMRALAPLPAHRRRVGGEKVRMTNRLPRTLNNSCPQGLQGFEDKDPAHVL